MEKIKELLLVLTIFFTMLLILDIAIILRGYNTVFTIPNFMKIGSNILLVLIWITSSSYILIKDYEI